MLYLALQLKALFQFITTVVEAPDVPWATKYDQVFSAHASLRVRELLQELRIPFDYYDPDADYEDDVMAFYNALKDTMKQVDALCPALEHLQAAHLNAALFNGLTKTVRMVEELMLGGLTREGLMALVQDNLKPAREALATARQPLSA